MWRQKLPDEELMGGLPGWSRQLLPDEELEELVGEGRGGGEEGEMGRRDWNGKEGRTGFGISAEEVVGRMRWSYQRSTAFVYSINALVSICVLYGLLIIPHILHQPRSVSVRAPSPRNGTRLPVRYTWEEKERVKKAVEARRAVEPVDLMKRVKELQSESVGKDSDSAGAEQKGGGVLEILRSRVMRGSRNRSSDELGQPPERLDSGLGTRLERVPESSPPSAKLNGGKLILDGPEIEDGIIPGKPLPAVCNAEPHTDYDGIAVTWGLTHPQQSAAECCQACLDQAKNAKAGEKRCNVWVYCPSEEGCFSPDIYKHTQLECWLKQAEIPTINFKGRYSPDYRQIHPKCPQVVAWVSGVILAS